MTGMAGKENLIEQFKSKNPYPPLGDKPQLVKAGEKQYYEGAVESNRGNRSRRFRIVEAGGKTYLCGYAYLIEVIREGSMMTLVTTTRIYSLTGRNLEEVERLIMEEKLKELHEFSESAHVPPENQDAVFIKKIEASEAGS